MDVSQCAQNADVQGLVASNTSDAVVQLIFSTNAVVAGAVSQYTSAIAQYAAGIEQCESGIAAYEAGMETLYNIEMQVGGSSILLGTSWPAVFLGLVVSIWRVWTKPSVRACLLFAIMCLTEDLVEKKVCDVAVLTWARSGDLRNIYGTHLYLFGKLLIPFSVVRGALMVIASSLRYRIVLISSERQRFLVGSAIVIGVGSATAEYITGYTSLAANEAKSVSNVFWAFSVVNPIMFAIMGLSTFTLQLRRSRVDASGYVPSENARQMRNLETINNALILMTVVCAVITITTVYAADPDSYFITPVEVTACAYWAVGENLFEVLALFKGSAESASASRIPTGVTGIVSFGKIGAVGGGATGAGSGVSREATHVMQSADLP
ncbi:hypothetical protein HDU87_008579 [Geranomyces variabilis]|uniref:Uncharacterized protein n=1 Tax=Geranomyces variabilis TaxID=109894 RepID=A0AAD5TR42_9FUNG|nr:hypothetical protein HDU87_008579 [Geranomyces variabilis]